ncbi:TAP-like protein-domain-containing protein [Mucidula mucida]|nr:TAP-like protein-domain-containing protein [Mucidula mucida]
MLRLTLLLLSCALLASAQAAFDWSSIEPSESLEWVNCLNGFQCARLQVPIDYSNEAGAKAALAVIKYASTVPADEYQGAILFNPGGPGGSGVDYLQAYGYGPLMAAVVGPQYDIISFDPRGLGVSSPRVEFFATEAERALWLANPYAMWANGQVLGQLTKVHDTSGLLEFIGTDDVARDMLRITEANGQDDLLYWGVSYGTAIGATFASLFPVSDWRNAILDTDKTMQTFYNGCHAAGPELCAFYASSPPEIEANLNALYASVLASPVPVYSPSSPAYGIVDYRVLRNAVRAALYAPYASFTTLAQGLAQLAAGNGSSIYQMQLDSAPFECGSSNSTSTYLNTLEVLVAVSCGDGVEITNSVTELQDYWTELSGISSFSDAMIWVRATCAGWKVHREDRFLGPVSGNTSFPLLFIGNTADPVTPLASANKTSAGFSGSAVLTLNAPGHTSFTASSTCVQSYIRDYFVNGTLPGDGIVCEVEAELFPSTTS